MSTTAARTRAPFAALAAMVLTAVVAVPAAAVGPAGAVNANDMAPGAYTADVVVGDFTVHSTSSKGVTVDGSSRVSDRGDVYTQRIKLNGSGDAAQRSLSFTVDGPTQVVVHARSGSGSSDRALALFDSSWTPLDSVPALADDDGAPIATEVLEVPAAGTYWIASPSSGVNLYYAQIGLDDPVARAAWSDVAAPTVDAIAVDPASPHDLLVNYTGLIGTDGADLARVALTDDSGTVVDRDLTATAGADGTLRVTPPASGAYTVQVSLTRAGEATALTSPQVEAPAFVLPLAAPDITGALTSAVSAGAATVTVEWGAVAEAETYTVEVDEGAGFTAAVDGVAGTSADVPGLTPGATVQIRVVAHRGDDAQVGPATEVSVASAVERWQAADIGSNAGSGGAITENEDGSILFDAKASSTKLASSEDGFQYFYTEVDPSTENFTLTATFRVDDASTKDSQSGFGVIAVDSLVAGSSPDRYFNSAGAVVTRYGEGTAEVVNGMPGARFVTGYTGATNDNTAGTRDQSGSEVFDSSYREEAGTAPRFDTGDTYTFSLRRSNTGFHAMWDRSGDGGAVHEVIEYDPDMLLVQDAERFYVGLAVARKIVVTVTDWEFTTVHPDDDDPAQERPIEQVPTSLSVDVTDTTPARSLDIPLVADFYGTGQILDASGAVVVDGLVLEPGRQARGAVSLEPGVNRFTARAIPGPDQPQLGEYEALESTDPVDVPVTITVDSFGEPGQSIWVAPDATSDGDGTRQRPVDIHTAVAFAQAGQQIVLMDGTYTPDRAIVADRGHDGTEDAPIVLMSEPGSRAVLDLSGSATGGINLRADWWHVYNLEITGSGDKAKPMLVQGHHNIVERVESRHNQDTGIQISGLSAEPPAMWPSHNLVVSSEAHHNADPGGNDADGFAAKLTVGEGNVFRSNIAHHNIDDGWDLYAKSTTGPIGTVVVEDSVAYNNGWLSEDPTRTGEGNGFKLGGESMPGDHLLRNSVSYGNLATGVTSNSGPDVRLENVTSVDNDRGIRLETNAAATDYRAAGVISWSNPSADVVALDQADTSLLTDPSNHFDGDGVTADWFVTTDASSVTPEIAPDGSVEMHGLYELTALAPADTGARLVANSSPTVIDLLPEVTSPEPGPDSWYPSTVYTRGDRVQHDGTIYEARWWNRGSEPGASAWGPWVEIGPADAAPEVAQCSAVWEASTVYHRGSTVSFEGVNYEAQWWSRSQVPGESVWGPWAALGACA
ncbi:carbohydrate-binding protein [Demequina sp. NBRC 110055]|uniref:carbohydrate-binding protein n=1 Tax=Demequina sp. NBRC 110055 TaxID=1570344 RepID=UPI001184CBEF|nr:carbohydrate-binding protein [Demequina sp. NBRC 110055]